MKEMKVILIKRKG